MSEKPIRVTIPSSKTPDEKSAIKAKFQRAGTVTEVGSFLYVVGNREQARAIADGEGLQWVFDERHFDIPQKPGVQRKDGWTAHTLNLDGKAEAMLPCRDDAHDAVSEIAVNAAQVGDGAVDAAVKPSS